MLLTSTYLYEYISPNFASIGQWIDRKFPKLLIWVRFPVGVQVKDFVTQLAEYHTFNVGVEGSNPSGVTKIKKIREMKLKQKHM